MLFEDSSGSVNVTDRQARVLAYIAAELQRVRLDRDGQPFHTAPTYSQIQNELGARSKNTATDYVIVLERKGLIERQPYHFRSLSLTTRGRAFLHAREQQTAA